MAEFGLRKSFDIDNGELDELSPQACFVLGYELSTIDHLLESEEAFVKLVHADNVSRVKRACEDARCMYELNWLPDDTSESWMELRVVKP